MQPDAPELESSSPHDSLIRHVRPLKSTPLPKIQLATVFAIKILIPITSFQVLPYINEMIERFGLSEGSGTGYYSGLLMSSFGIAHVLSMYPWARLSDSIGRVPVMLMGILGAACSIISFGMSRNLPALLVSRFFSGLFSGTTGAIHSVVGELTDSTNQSTAFPLYDICSAFGFVVGPLIGGTFADPAIQYPQWFDTAFFRAYPYFLPCFVNAALAIGASLLCVFVLEETLASKRKSPATTSVSSESLAATYGRVSSDERGEGSVGPPSIKSLLSISIIRAICASSAALGFIAGSFNVVFVLMAHSPVNEGGLSLAVPQIGRALSLMGALSIVLKLLMPFLLSRFDNLKVFQLCMLIWPFTFASMPLLNLLARKEHGDSAAYDALLWIPIACVLVLSRIGCMAFSIIMILVKDHAPGSSSLGTTNGITEVAQSLAGSVGTPITSSLFALSASKHLLGGYLWVVFIITVSLLGGSFADWVKKCRDKGAVRIE